MSMAFYSIMFHGLFELWIFEAVGGFGLRARALGLGFLCQYVGVSGSGKTTLHPTWTLRSFEDFDGRRLQGQSSATDSHALALSFSLSQQPRPQRPPQIPIVPWSQTLFETPSPWNL